MLIHFVVLTALVLLAMLLLIQYRTAQASLATLAHTDSCSTAVDQHLHELFCWADFQLLFPKPAVLHGVVLIEVHIVFYFVFKQALSHKFLFSHPSPRCTLSFPIAFSAHLFAAFSCFTLSQNLLANLPLSHHSPLSLLLPVLISL